MVSSGCSMCLICICLSDNSLLKLILFSLCYFILTHTRLYSNNQSPNGNNLTPFLNKNVSIIKFAILVPQCSIHRNEAMNNSFSLIDSFIILLSLVLVFLPHLRYNRSSYCNHHSICDELSNPPICP